MLCTMTNHFIGQDVDVIEEGGKHTLILYNCKVSMTGEVVYTAANAKCSANLKVKGKPMSFKLKQPFIVKEMFEAYLNHHFLQNFL